MLTSPPRPADRYSLSRQPARHAQAKERHSFHAFLVSLAVLAYAGGVATVHFGLFPYPQLWQSYTDVKDFIQHWKNDLGIEPTRYLVAGRGSTGAEMAPQRDRAAPGLRIVAGYFRNRAAATGALLLDEQGKERHFWPIDYQEISAAIEQPFPHARHNFLHGFEVMRDGSIVVSFDSGGVLARLDACGRVIWALPGGYHHAVSLQGDGTLWAVGGPGSDLYANAISRIDPEQGTLLQTTQLSDGLLARMGKGVFFIRRIEEAPEPSWLPDRCTSMTSSGSTRAWPKPSRCSKRATSCCRCAT